MGQAQLNFFKGLYKWKRLISSLRRFKSNSFTSLQVKDLVRLCQTSSTLRQLFSDKRFWRRKFEEEGLPLLEEPKLPGAQGWLDIYIRSYKSDIQARKYLKETKVPFIIEFGELSPTTAKKISTAGIPVGALLKLKNLYPQEGRDYPEEYEILAERAGLSQETFYRLARDQVTRGPLVALRRLIILRGENGEIIYRTVGDIKEIAILAISFSITLLPRRLDLSYLQALLLQKDCPRFDLLRVIGE